VSFTNTGGDGLQQPDRQRARWTLAGTNTGFKHVGRDESRQLGRDLPHEERCRNVAAHRGEHYTGATAVNRGPLSWSRHLSGGGAFTVASGASLRRRRAGRSRPAASRWPPRGLNISGGGAVTPGVLTLALGTGSLDLSATAGTGTGELGFTLGTASDKVVLSSAGSTLNIGTGLLSLADSR